MLPVLLELVLPALTGALFALAGSISAVRILQRRSPQDNHRDQIHCKAICQNAHREFQLLEQQQRRR
ncbi:unnamed protein product [Lampetra planeri]